MNEWMNEWIQKQKWTDPLETMKPTKHWIQYSRLVTILNVGRQEHPCHHDQYDREWHQTRVASNQIR